MTRPAPGPPRAARFPAVTRETLPSGLRVLVAARHELPVVHLLFVARAGTALDPADRPGLAGTVAEMLTEGTATRTRDRILEQIEFVGGQISASADEDRLTVGAAVLREHLPVALDLLADVARNPSFPEPALDKVRRRLRADLAQGLSDPAYLARRRLFAVLFGERHPYGRLSPTFDAIDATRREDLTSFHAGRVGAAGALLVVAGDVDPGPAVELAARAFQDGARASAAPSSPPDPPAPADLRVWLVDRPGSVQAHIQVGAVALARSDPGWMPLLVGQQVLGGSASARLFLRLREERSLTYGAYARLSARIGRGPLVASASTRNQTAAESLSELLREIRRLAAEPIEEEEAARARGYLGGLFPTQIETAGNVAAMVAQQEFFRLPPDYWDGYRAAIEAVSAEQARAAVADALAPGRLAAVVAGDAAALEKDLAALAPVTVCAAS